MSKARGRHSNRKKKRGRPSKKGRKSINSGRKKVNIKNASTSTKYNRVNELLDSNDLSTIELAIRVGRKRANANSNVNVNLNSNENRDENFDKEISEYSNIRHSNESALAFFLEYDYSVNQYKALVQNSHQRKSNIYPAYNYVKVAMVQCKPQNYFVSEVEVSVPLQNMLNITAERLCESVATEWNEDELLNLELIVTAGFDSSSGHTNPQQSYECSENANLNAHESLFVSNMLIIKLQNSISSKPFWINPTPQSTRFCRPLRIAVEKEDEKAIICERNRLQESIRLLVPHKFKLQNGKSVKVRHNIALTLFDKKCVNTIVGNKASSRCPMCLKSTHAFGNLDDNFNVNESSLKYGLGLLHCELKCFEHLLHIAYRIPIESWDVRKICREKFEEQKRIIQKNILDKIGVRVDQVLQGHGTTNTGNVARRCFENPNLFAEALGIDAKLVENISIILLTFKSKKLLKLDELELFCSNTYALHYQLYSWARMNPTLHKLLKHGCDIVRQFPVPIAYYSEDASESCHKIYRKNLKLRARQNSRKNRLLDVFNRAIYLSDPKISLIEIKNRLRFWKKKKGLVNFEQFIESNEDSEHGDSEIEDSEGEVTEDSDS